MSPLFERWQNLRAEPSQPGFLSRHRSSLLSFLNAILLVLALLAVSSLVAEYGFYLSEPMTRLARLVTVVVLYGFVIQAFLKILIVEHRRAHIRSRWGEFVLFLMIFLHLLFPETVGSLLLSLDPRLTPEALARVYLIVTQFFVVIALLPSTLRASRRVMTMNIQPSMLILLSFALLILLGTGLLLLPRATMSHSFSFIDALFTATSAVCVTGLIVVDTATYFTPTGHTVLLLLIQVGGLGIMTLTTFFAFIVGSGTNLKEYSTMQSLLGDESVGMIRRTVLQIALVTFLIEAVGAFTLYSSVKAEWFQTSADHLFFSIFHAVSAFCNAGFALTVENVADPLLRHNMGVNLSIMMLVVVGGLGFPVLKNIGHVLWLGQEVGRQRRLTVHAKLVLLASLVLIVLGAVGFLLLEYDTSLEPLPPEEKILASLFQSISARTAGFNTVDIGTLGLPTLFLLIFLMWIGASPGSTGGGIKTTTLVLAFLNIHAIASGRNKVEVFRKQVTELAVVKAFSTVILSIFFIGTAVFLLLLTEHMPLEALMFEVVSAMSTVGFSTGITPHLSVAGKLIIILCMFVGRVGLLAVVVALTRHRKGQHYDFTQENVLVT